MISKAWDNIIYIGDSLGIPVSKPEIGVFRRELPFLSGKYKNHVLTIRTEMRGSGKSRKAYSILELNVPGVNTSYGIYKEGLFSKIGKVLGMQDIQTGFDEFDRKFLLQSSDPDKAIRVFDMNLCGKITDTFDSMESGIYLKNSIISYSEPGYINKEAKRDRYITIAKLCIDIILNAEKIG